MNPLVNLLGLAIAVIVPLAIWKLGKIAARKLKKRRRRR